MSVRELLAEYVRLLVADSPEAAAMIERHGDNAEFVAVARLSRFLRDALRG